jgi:transposase
MREYSKAAMERTMKVQEVILRAMSGQIFWFEAAEILGISCRSMSRWKRRYEKYGYDGLFDRRCQRPSPKRVPVENVKEVLRLYREEYRDFNVLHFHEKLVEDHGIKLSYEWVKKALQMSGLVAKGRKRGKHRKRRERRPLRGMMVYCDGSDHSWLPLLENQRQDLVAFLDDATGDVYDAYLVDEEGTLTVMEGLKRIFEKEGLFCSFYTDRGSHFFHTPKAGGPVNKAQLTQIGRALDRLGIEHIPSYSPQARGRMERFFETWQGRLPQELRKAGIKTVGEANKYIRNIFIPWHNSHLTVPALEAGSAFVPCENTDLDGILCIQEERIVQNDNTVIYGNRHLQIEPVQWRVSFAKSRVKVCEHLDGRISVRLGPRILGYYTGDGLLIKQLNKKGKVA